MFDQPVLLVSPFACFPHVQALLISLLDWTDLDGFLFPFIPGLFSPPKMNYCYSFRFSVHSVCFGLQRDRGENNRAAQRWKACEDMILRHLIKLHSVFCFSCSLGTKRPDFDSDLRTQHCMFTGEQTSDLIVKCDVCSQVDVCFTLTMVSAF